ncbi:MAG: hypothetical protein AB7J32_10685 [Pseudonocardia sp.]
MSTHHDPRSVRARLSDRLLRTGTDLAADRIATTRRIEAAPDHPGRDAALAALACARWVDTTLLWLAWRLCPRDTIAGPIAPR